MLFGDKHFVFKSNVSAKHFLLSVPSIHSSLLFYNFFDFFFKRSKKYKIFGKNLIKIYLNNYNFYKNYNYLNKFLLNPFANKFLKKNFKNYRKKFIYQYGRKFFFQSKFLRNLGYISFLSFFLSVREFCLLFSRIFFFKEWIK